MLVITSRSLKRKKPRSLRVTCPDGIDTRSNSRKARSGVTRSFMPSITPSSSRKAVSRCPFSSASFSLQLRKMRISCTSFKASCSGFWSGCATSQLITLCHMVFSDVDFGVRSGSSSESEQKLSGIIISVGLQFSTADGRALLAFAPTLPAPAVSCSVMSFSLEPFSSSASSSGEAVSPPFGVSGVCSVKLRSEGVRLFCDRRTSSRLRFCCLSLALEALRLFNFSCPSEPPRRTARSGRWSSSDSFLLSSLPVPVVEPAPDRSDFSESVLRCSMLPRYRLEEFGAVCATDESDSFEGLEEVRTSASAPPGAGEALVRSRDDARSLSLSDTESERRKSVFSERTGSAGAGSVSSFSSELCTTDTLCVAVPSTIVVNSLLSGSVQMMDTGGVRSISSDPAPPLSSDSSKLTCGSMT
uniref:Uncharacterized protein n=1 Tax=Anopheles atroparvus TaxID=41427 RepID=A0A182J2J6_ANOAO